MIGVTGATSAIGRAVLEAAGDRGLETAALGRTGSPDQRFYDLGRPVAAETLDGLDAVIHLAWSWDAAPGANVSAGRTLADACAARGIRPVLLSTFSAFEEASLYGADKRALESRFAATGGAAVRAGLIWGNEPAGIVATLAKLARLPLLAPRLSPDPQMRHSNERDLAQTLLTAAVAEGSGTTVLGASQEFVSLAKLMARLRGDRPGVSVPTPTKALTALAAAAERVHVPLPFRSDSLAALNPTASGATDLASFSWAPGFQGTTAMLDWAAAATDT